MNSKGKDMPQYLKIAEKIYQNVKEKKKVLQMIQWKILTT